MLHSKWDAQQHISTMCQFINLSDIFIFNMFHYCLNKQNDV